MLSDLDLWRAAQVMIKRYGDGAATEAAMRADEFLDQGTVAVVRCAKPFCTSRSTGGRLNL